MNTIGSSDVYGFVLAYAAEKVVTFEAASNKLVALRRLSWAEKKTIDFSRHAVRKKELQRGILRMCKFAVNEISARNFVSKFVGVSSDNLGDHSSVFKLRMPELRPLGLIGAMFRVKERLRCVIEPELRKNFDIIAEQDIAHVRTLLAMDQIMFVYQHKFINFIDSVINTISDPNTDMKVIISSQRDSNNKTNIVAGKPFTRAYEQHRTALTLLDSNGNNGIPVDSKGDPSRVMGGTCTLCNVHTREGLTDHKPVCPFRNDPDHLVGCPICLNDPSHGFLTCPTVCRVTFRSYRRQSHVKDFVKHYKNHPMASYNPHYDKKEKKQQGKKKKQGTK